MRTNWNTENETSVSLQIRSGKKMTQTDYEANWAKYEAEKESKYQRREARRREREGA